MGGYRIPDKPTVTMLRSEEVRSLCDSLDGMLIVDPTMSSPKNSKVAELADALVNSLTKYASWEGDVMIGSLVFLNIQELEMKFLKIRKNRSARLREIF